MGGGTTNDGLETRRWNGNKSACADCAAAVVRGPRPSLGRGCAVGKIRTGKRSAPARRGPGRDGSESRWRQREVTSWPPRTMPTTTSLPTTSPLRSNWMVPDTPSNFGRVLPMVAT
jgi:hypothetical protein